MQRSVCHGEERVQGKGQNPRRNGCGNDVIGGDRAKSPNARIRTSRQLETTESSSIEAAAPAEDLEDSDRASAFVAAEEIVVEAEEVQRVDGETPETGERRPKRRHSRRGKKKGARDEAKPAVAAKPAEEEVSPPSAESPDEDRRGRKDKRIAKAERVEDEDQLSDEGSESERLSPRQTRFSGIPTWDEAVGLIIAKNLEARSKRGSGGDSGGSGGSAKDAAAGAVTRKTRRARWTRRQTVTKQPSPSLELNDRVRNGSCRSQRESSAGGGVLA